MRRADERTRRARRIVRYLKRAYPNPKTELVYYTPFQMLASVVLSAQCTDKHVNRVTTTLWKKYKTPKDFISVPFSLLQKDLSSVPFFRNKAKALQGAAHGILERHSGRVPRTERELVALPGIGYKTAHVILGELYDIWEGIPTDTHVKRFARRFDLSKESDLKKISKDLEAFIPKKDWKYVNNGLVLYGRYVCKARPHECAEHPLTKLYPKAGSKWPRTTD
ncbi:MAG: endonuclease III [Minisyncoccia bacterium]